MGIIRKAAPAMKIRNGSIYMSVPVTVDPKWRYSKSPPDAGKKIFVYEGSPRLNFGSLIRAA